MKKIPKLPILCHSTMQARRYSGEAPAAEINPLDAAKIEIAELKDKYLRLYADFENFRRRTAKEKLEMISGASADTVKADPAYRR
jgi:molecular chaperone GrpE (heat shock protein)